MLKMSQMTMLKPLCVALSFFVAASCGKKEREPAAEEVHKAETSAESAPISAPHEPTFPRTAFEKGPDATHPGAETFRLECAMCHRGFSTGVIMLERRLGKDSAILEQRTDLTADYIRAVVRNGLVNMPPFSKVELTDEELDEIAAFLTRNNEEAE